MALYNKMRPKNLGEVRGQSKIIEILRNNIASNNLPNAMLFVGTRGVGKTTVAKAVARLLNCEQPLEDGSCCDACPSCKAILAGTSLDVRELDAASNNGVDNIREIIESVQYKPIGKMKVIILDEVHMLSGGAFNALLKVMEEPPKNVLFILCTTELHKVPATIVSRCRKFQFETISVDVIVEKLKAINSLLRKEAEEEALYLIAKAAKGSMRDAESIYESFLDGDDLITASYVRETLGFTSDESVFGILDAISNADPMMATAVIDDVFEKGGSLNFLLEECMHTLMDIISIKMSGDITDKGNSADYLEKISTYAFNMETQRLFEIADAFCKTYGSKTADKHLIFQSMLIELACTQSTITELLNRVKKLEETVEKIQKANVSFVAPVCDVSEEKTAHFATDAFEQQSVDENEEMLSNATQDNFNAFDENGLTEAPSLSLSDDAYSELRSLGFTVVDEMPDFEEESLDESMLEMSEGEQENVTTKTDGEKEQSGFDTGASFFDDFARLFNM